MSIYGNELKLDQCAAIAISQSGKSPDIVAMAQSARRNGALTFALTNTAGSPLAAAADFTIDLAAGEEKSVAATKSFVSSVVAGLGLLAHWQDDAALIAALDDLPARPRNRRRLRLERARSPRSTATSRSTSSAAARRWRSPTRRR